MILFRLGASARSRTVAARALWGAAGALAHAAWGLSVKPLLWLPSSRADDPMRRADAEPATSGAAPQPGAFEQWFARYQVPLLEYLYGMTRDREWAADLAQETFLRAFAAASHDPAAIEHPQAWLYRIATNVALSALRRNRRFDWLPLSRVEPEVGAGDSDRWRRMEQPAPHSQDVATTIAERDAVWAVLAELPPRWRAALLLQATADLRTREIAAELGVSETNARKILFRAKERFRQITLQIAAAEAKGGAR
jgi:RNA polymerase sigma-70 factor, ECF subfamily